MHSHLLANSQAKFDILTVFVSMRLTFHTFYFSGQHVQKKANQVIFTIMEKILEMPLKSVRKLDIKIKFLYYLHLNF